MGRGTELSCLLADWMPSIPSCTKGKDLRLQELRLSGELSCLGWNGWARDLNSNGWNTVVPFRTNWLWPTTHWRFQRARYQLDTLTATTLRSLLLYDYFFTKNQIQLLTNLTHKLGNILDLVRSNSPDRIINITNDLNLLSDHHLDTLMKGP